MFSTRSDLEDVPSTRVHDPYKAFEIIVDRVLGDRVRADGARGVDLWCALANVEWRGPGGHTISYSFRRAGELVAWVREDGDGMDYPRSLPTGSAMRWPKQGGHGRRLGNGKANGCRVRCEWCLVGIKPAREGKEVSLSSRTSRGIGVKTVGSDTSRPEFLGGKRPVRFRASITTKGTLVQAGGKRPGTVRFVEP